MKLIIKIFDNNLFSRLVEFELDDFDMTPYCLNPDIACEGQKPVYDLVGVVNHMGSMVC